MVDIKRLIIFSILMENGKGILAKSPKYIQEKFNLSVGGKYPDHLLDLANHEKFRTYMKNWEAHLK